MSLLEQDGSRKTEVGAANLRLIECHGFLAHYRLLSVVFRLPSFVSRLPSAVTRLLLTAVATTLASGCNNAMTLRDNFDRAADARREADEARRDTTDDSRTAARTTPRRLFPPFKRTESAEENSNRPGAYAPPRNASEPGRTPTNRFAPAPRGEIDGPVFPQLLPARDRVDTDDDGEVQQTSAQFPAPVSGSSLAGRIVDSSGRPQPGVTVVATATRRPGGARVESRTDRQGGFVLSGLEPGQRYLVLATAANSREPLIGRVATTAPDRDVVIEIARPFATNRSTNTPASSAARQNSATPPTSAPKRVAENQPNIQRDMWDRVPSGTPPTTVRPPSGSSPQGTNSSQPRKKTMQEVIAENQRESPWDMPAPPQRRTPPQQVTAVPNSKWQPAGERKPYGGATSSPSLLDHLPTDKPLVESTAPEIEDQTTNLPRANASTPTDQPVESPRAGIDPTRPLSQPLNIGQSNPKLENTPADGTRPGKLNIELEGDSPTSSKPDAEPLPYNGPKCEFDGNRLVEFQLPDLDDKPISFSRLGGRLVLVDFWGTWCPYCLKSMPNLVSLKRRYGPLGLQVVGIAYEQGPASERVTRVREVRDQLGVNYPILLGDGDGKCPVHEKFGIKHYPTLVLLDRSGRVLWRREGPDEKDLQQLEKLLKSQLTEAPR